MSESFDAWATEATAVNEDGTLKHPDLVEAGLVEQVVESVDAWGHITRRYVAVGGDTGVVRALEWLLRGNINGGHIFDIAWAVIKEGSSLPDAVWDACLRAIKE